MLKKLTTLPIMVFSAVLLALVTACAIKAASADGYATVEKSSPGPKTANRSGCTAHTRIPPNVSRLRRISEKTRQNCVL